MGKFIAFRSLAGGYISIQTIINERAIFNGNLPYMKFVLTALCCCF